ncbi:MAG: 4'-phosphopantetheinyl transferase superfamily protein, partial [Helicobacter japonicus]|nr:4'-phosphopantetheinyl transferase superfamily protein [Helicobacter japonicus]
MIGIDIVSIARMRTFVEKFGIKALRRFLSNDEIALCLKQSGQSQVKIDNDIPDSKICLESALPCHHTSIDMLSIN